MVAARRGNDVALAGDLSCEASNGAGDYPGDTPHGQSLVIRTRKVLYDCRTLVDLTEEHNSREATGRGV